MTVMYRGGEMERGGMAQAIIPALPWARGIIWLLIVVCTLGQVVIDMSYANVASCIITAAGAAVATGYVFRPKLFPVYPVSSCLLFGLTFTLELGPLVFQTFDYRALTFNLFVPTKTALVTCCVVVLAIVVHALYASSGAVARLRMAFGQRVLGPFFAFTPPTNVQMWLMGFVGFVAIAVSGTFAAGSAIEYGDVGGKFMQGFIPFAAVPFLIPLSGYLFRPGQHATKIQWIFLAIYFVALLVLSMARNSRAGFAGLLLILGMCLFLAIFSGKIRPSGKTVLQFVIAGLLALPIYSLFADASTAMLINRSSRSSISADALIRTTLSTMSDKQALESYRARSSIVTSGFNEVYIRNDFLQRVTLLKFLDTNLRNAEGISDSQRTYAQESFKRKLLAYIPAPITSALRIDVNKDSLGYSGGDLYRFLAADGGLGSYILGSSIADGLAIMGAMFWVYCAGIFLFSFFIYDAFSRPVSGYGVLVSPIVLILMDKIFMLGLVGESIAAQLGTFLRSVPQTIFLYALLFAATYVIDLMLKVFMSGGADRVVRPGSWGRSR